MKTVFQKSPIIMKRTTKIILVVFSRRKIKKTKDKGYNI